MLLHTSRRSCRPTSLIFALFRRESLNSYLGRTWFFKFVQSTHYRLPRHLWFCGRKDNGITEWKPPHNRPIRESPITITIVRRDLSYCRHPMNSQPSFWPRLRIGDSEPGHVNWQPPIAHCLSNQPIGCHCPATSSMNILRLLAMKLATRTRVRARPEMWLLRDLTTEKTLYCGSTPKQNTAIMGFILKRGSSFIIYNVDGRSNGSIAREILISELCPLKGEAEASSWRE